MLINNAGISIRHDFLDITPENWSRVIATNVITSYSIHYTKLYEPSATAAS